MNDLTDQQLLRNYAERQSETAFAELVRRHVDLVYSAGLRMVRDSHLAEDVTQAVFVALAQNARQLGDRPVLSGWLHRTAQNLASKSVRSEVRRRAREQEALAMKELLSTEPGDVWEHIAPHLDAALGELPGPDRDALLLRYFQRRSAHEMAETLGISDEAAQKRVSRAVERLRDIFARRGLTVGASGLVVVISANAVQTAPVGLAAALTAASLASVAAAGGTLTLLNFMTAGKLKLGVVGALIASGVLLVLFLRQNQNNSAERSNSPQLSGSEDSSKPAVIRRSSDRASSGFSRSEADAAPVATAQEVVASKLARFGKSRRELVGALARRHGVEVPDAVKLFFDAVESGIWDDIEVRFKAINGGDSSAGHAAGRPPGVEHLWPAIIDAYGAAEQAHLWPAQQLLDYGKSILDPLRPGMVYMGGNDTGRWIPELVNDTSDGERHIIVTQNGLADGTYRDYLTELYGNRMATLTQEDSDRIFQEYITDARKRLQHDEQFPGETKQVRPGESIKMVEGHVQVSGMVGVMAINEKLLQLLLEKNPGLSFAVQESFPMKGTYADAIPLGPLMELRAQSDQNTFTPERAAQSLDYWRTTAQNVLADPEASGSPVALKSYSHDATSAANLLAAHNYTAEAEQAYRLATQLSPSNPEAVGGLAAILAHVGRGDEARQMLDDFAHNYPDQRSDIEAFRGSILWTTRSAKPSP